MCSINLTVMIKSLCYVWVGSMYTRCRRVIQHDGGPPRSTGIHVESESWLRNVASKLHVGGLRPLAHRDCISYDTIPFHYLINYFIPLHNHCQAMN